ncbi:MAG: CusA/CzcA family heavy metal efflux RND transporter, partial [Deltaproteobacteria bacterium CG_4_10_14_0_2_um_filter_43_8]
KYLDIDVNRETSARLGLHVGDVQDMVETAIGGMNISTAIEGRSRFPIRVRYAKDFRNDPENLKQVLVANAWNWRNPAPRVQVPLGQVANINITSGPPMISSENSLLRAIVFLNVRGRDVGSFVDEAKAKLEKEIKLPQGYYLSWSGQYENQLRAKQKLQLLIPAVILIIFLFLYFTFHSWSESLLVVLSVPFGLIGGLFLQWLLGYNFSVAVWVGYIALSGVVVETGVVMLVYLNEALETRIQQGIPITKDEIYQATLEGSLLRLRPKLMTVGTSLIGLIPIMWSTGTGSDLTKPLATPLIGGMLSSTVLVLIIIPLLFMSLKQKEFSHQEVKMKEG